MKIELADNEEELFSRIKKSVQSNMDIRDVNMFDVYELTKTLINTDKIPKHRQLYFISSKYATGQRRGKSWREIFESNGTTGDAIYRHPHFIEFLMYFIEGPDLSHELISKANKIIGEAVFKDDGAEKFWQYLKKEKLIPSRNNGRKKFAEEIFKLMIELSCEVSTAKHYRDRIMRT